MLQSNKVSGYGRDSAMELIIKNMLRNDGVQWSRKFLDTDGESFNPRFKRKLNTNGEDICLPKAKNSLALKIMFLD